MENKQFTTGFYFELSFKGENTAFREVTGIAKEMGMEEMNGEGENRFKYRLPAQPTHQNLILKRAMVPKGSLLIDWCASCIDNGLAHQITTQNISLSLLDASGSVSIMWTFYNAYPVKYVVAELKAQENAIVVESIELAYTYFEVAPTSLFGNLFD